MKGFIARTAAGALSVTLVLGAAVVPCAASGHDGRQPASTPKLTKLSPASQQMLRTAAKESAAQQQTPAATPTSAGSFFHSKRGAVTLALMGAGTGLALWSIQHDRKPVKSPVR